MQKSLNVILVNLALNEREREREERERREREKRERESRDGHWAFLRAWRSRSQSPSPT